MCEVTTEEKEQTMPINDNFRAVFGKHRCFKCSAIIFQKLSQCCTFFQLYIYIFLWH